MCTLVTVSMLLTLDQVLKRVWFSARCVQVDNFRRLCIGGRLGQSSVLRQLAVTKRAVRHLDYSG